MSGRKNKRENENCTEEMFNDMRSLCEDYAFAMKRLKKNRELLDDTIREHNSAGSNFERDVYDNDISELEKRIRKDDEDTSYFRWSLSHLSERERTVMTQLYVDRYTWDSVISESGEMMTAGAINSARKRAIRKMAVLIADKKKTMAEFQEASSNQNNGKSL